MKRVLSFVSLGCAVVGTSLWAQQEQPPALSPGLSSPAVPAATASANDEAQEALSDADANAIPNNADAKNLSRAVGRARGLAPNAQNAPLPARGGPAYSTAPMDAVPRGYYQQGEIRYPTIQPYAAPGANAVSAGSPAGPPMAGLSVPQQYGYSGPVYVHNAEEIQGAQEFAKTLQALRTATTDDQRAELRKKLNDQIGEQLDRDLEAREHRLAEIEAKAKSLREQLTQRKQNKAEIQKMLVMLAENPQGGLLPPEWMNVIAIPGYNVPQSTYLRQ